MCSSHYLPTIFELAAGAKPVPSDQITDVGPRVPYSERAWYAASIYDFCWADANAILGLLTANAGGFSVEPSQRDAWVAQISFLKEALSGLEGSIFLEFSIPRMGRRLDAALLVGPVIFAVEFKVGATGFDRSAIEQVWDYALDLKNFHKGSHHLPIVPILVCTHVKQLPKLVLYSEPDGVFHPVLTNNRSFREVLDGVLSNVQGEAMDAQRWAATSYKPTPTIIEAARSLYARHSVENITRSEATATNLRVTSQRLERIAAEAKERGRKAICFVTGVPGAGKTLVGLNIATRHDKANEGLHAVFLSGNAPLVAVLREALVRDEFERRRKTGETKVYKGKIAESVKAFIQNVHHFRDEALISPGPPPEHVVIFDEAQRAWNLQKTANFMTRKKNRPGFSQSEPEFLISCLDRHEDWATIICLVGGGQEINTGEAGIDAWFEAVEKSFPHWDLYISPHLTDSEYAAGKAVERAKTRGQSIFDDSLHLSVPMRSFRAEEVSGFVKALLDCDSNVASSLLRRFSGRYPIKLTRDLAKAKQWVKKQARGSERYGLLASSRAQRLKPHAIDVRVVTDPVLWFLNDRDDTRSSYYLEDVATEFQVQGLELDWACVTWDADFRYSQNSWTHHDFRGTAWTNIHNAANRVYLRNAYRVLLTRARQGMVIFVPDGDGEDPTRSPEYYDSTFDYLRGLGIATLS